MSEMAKVAYLNRNDDGTPKVDEGCYLFANEVSGGVDRVDVQEPELVRLGKPCQRFCHKVYESKDTTSITGPEVREKKGNMSVTQIENVDADQIKSFRDFLISYNKLSEMCFKDCVWDFTTRGVKSQEDRCALNCMEKYLKMNQRVSQRFQEFQLAANENAMAAANTAGH